MGGEGKVWQENEKDEKRKKLMRREQMERGEEETD